MDAFYEWVAAEVKALGGDPASVNATPKERPQEDREYKKAYVMGVYLLRREQSVVYVGQSQNVYKRIVQHMERAPFNFDSFSFMECVNSDERMQLEAKLINDMEPIENAQFPAYADSPSRLRKTNPSRAVNINGSYQ